VGPGGVVPLWSDENERARERQRAVLMCCCVAVLLCCCVAVLLCCRAGAGAVLVSLPEAAIILPLFLRSTHVPR
jgi:hypothetical protein